MELILIYLFSLSGILGSIGSIFKSISIGTFEKMFLYVFGLILNDILSIISSIAGIILSIIMGIVSSLVNFAISMGPFGLPIFFIGTITIIGALYSIFHIIHDTPLVGDFV